MHHDPLAGDRDPEQGEATKVDLGDRARQAQAGRKTICRDVAATVGASMLATRHTTLLLAVTGTVTPISTITLPLTSLRTPTSTHPTCLPTTWAAGVALPIISIPLSMPRDLRACIRRKTGPKDNIHPRTHIPLPHLPQQARCSNMAEATASAEAVQASEAINSVVLVEATAGIISRARNGTLHKRRLEVEVRLCKATMPSHRSHPIPPSQASSRTRTISKSNQIPSVRPKTSRSKTRRPR